MLESDVPADPLANLLRIIDSFPMDLRVAEDVPSLIKRVLRKVRRCLSSVGITADGVQVRNLPWRRRCLALDQVIRFDWRPEETNRVGIVLLADGNEVVVWALDPNRPGCVTEFNNALPKTPT